jgi:DNA-binding MarR family transcriptional regulator
MTAGKDVARGLRAAYLLMHRKTQSVLAVYGITADQYVLLARLSTEDGIMQKELTERVSSDPNTVRGMLVLLEDKGLVERKRHETDRRAHRVFLTIRGRRLYAKSDRALRPLRETMLAPLSQEEAQALVLYLDRVVEAMRPKRNAGRGRGKCLQEELP